MMVRMGQINVPGVSGTCTAVGAGSTGDDALSKKGKAILFSYGVSVDRFLELLSVHLSSLFVVYDEVFFVQRKGVCIGSCVAPILSDIFLASFDRSIKDQLTNKGVGNVFRYADGFLLLFRNGSDFTIAELLELFRDNGKGFLFTHEEPANNILQFLYLELSFEGHHVCWKHKPRLKKSLLPYDSAHSKITKQGIVKSCLTRAMRRSCLYAVDESFCEQVSRIRKVGCPEHLLVAVAQGILRTYRVGDKKKEKKVNNLAGEPWYRIYTRYLQPEEGCGKTPSSSSILGAPQTFQCTLQGQQPT